MLFFIVFLIWDFVIFSVMRVLGLWIVFWVFIWMYVFIIEINGGFKNVL